MHYYSIDKDINLLAIIKPPSPNLNDLCSKFSILTRMTAYFPGPSSDIIGKVIKIFKNQTQMITFNASWLDFDRYRYLGFHVPVSFCCSHYHQVMLQKGDRGFAFLVNELIIYEITKTAMSLSG